jgi:hypothetical protein
LACQRADSQGTRTFASGRDGGCHGLTRTARERSSAATVAIACLLALLAAGCAGSEELTCADTVLVDWNNGRLSSAHAPACYRDALEALPEDARLYTTAPEEIMRALRASLAARAPGRESAKKSGHEQGAAATGSASRQLSGRARERRSAPAAAEAETTAAPAPGALTEPTSLPLPVALTATLILVVGAGGVTNSVAKRLRGRRLARRGAPGPL